MKRTLLTIMVALCLLLAGNATALAQDAPQVRVNARLVDFPDAQPFIDESSRTLMPVRFIVEDMEATVSWDSASQTASVQKEGVTVEITIGQQEIKVTAGGVTKTVAMDTTAVLRQERTYVPIRYIAEALGAHVGYSDLYHTVQISDGVLSAAEIDRLQSYPSVQEYTYENSQPEYAHFTGENGFANAKEYALRAPVTCTVVSMLGDHSFTANDSGGAWGEFLATEAALQLSALYSYDYESDPSMVSSKEWDYLGKSSVPALQKKADDSVANRAKIAANFRTDAAGIYQDLSLANVNNSIRGILEVQVAAPTNREWAAELLGLDKVEYDQLYAIDLDAKFILRTNNYSGVTVLTIIEPLSGKRTVNLATYNYTYKPGISFKL